MKTMTTLLLAIIATVGAAGRSGQDPERLFRAALNLETVDGDLKGAIEGYRKVAGGTNRGLAAHAELRIAECYRKLGDSRAADAFRTVLTKYPEQEAVAYEARLRLSTLAIPNTTRADSNSGVHVVLIDPRTARPRGAATPLIDLEPDPTGSPAAGMVGCAPAWAPDGKAIAYKRRALAPPRQFEIVIRTLSTKEERSFPVGTADPGCWSGPVWFPDGRSFAVKSFMELKAPLNSRVDLDTAQASPLTVPPYKSAIAVGREAIYGTLHDTVTKTTALVRIELATGAQRTIWQSPFPFEDFLVPLRLALSPDERTLALVMKAGLDSRLITVTVDGRDYRELYAIPYDYRNTGLSRSGLGWTADGRSVLFMDSDRAGQRLLRIPVEGGLPEFTGIVMRVATDVMFDVSPDGARLAFSPGAPTVVLALAGGR
jgi:hypothetical protein